MTDFDRNVDTARTYRDELKRIYDYMYTHRAIDADGGEDEDSQASKNRKWVHDTWLSAKLYLKKLNSDDPPDAYEQDWRWKMQKEHLDELVLSYHGSMIVTQRTVDKIIELLYEEEAHDQYYAEDDWSTGSEFSSASTVPDQDTGGAGVGGRRKRRSSRKRRKTKRVRKKRSRKKRHRKRRYTKKRVKRHRRRKRTRRRK